MKSKTAARLQEEYLKRLRKNPRFSKRAFARQIGLSSGALVEILAGRRDVSRRTAEKLVAYFGWNKGVQPAEDERYEHEADSVRLDADQFELIARLEHFHVLALLGSTGRRYTQEDLARRLGLDLRSVEGVLARLLSLGLLKRDDEGYWLRTARPVSVPSSIGSEAKREAHREALLRALQALDTVSPEERDFNIVLKVISRRRLSDLQEIVRRFREELHALGKDDTDEDVYQINLQIFPVTKPEEEK